jgi:hypothetical protein
MGVSHNFIMANWHVQRALCSLKEGRFVESLNASNWKSIAFISKHFVQVQKEVIAE